MSSPPAPGAADREEPGAPARALSLALLAALIAGACFAGTGLLPADFPEALVAAGHARSPAPLPGGALLLVPAALALLVSRRFGAGFRLAWRFRLTHALPSTVQLLIFVYWGLYWRPVREHVPALVFQLLFAYAVDGLVSLAHRRRWDLSLGPVPVVLSANLFAQYAPAEMNASLAVIALALTSKAFLARADGKHVFNPSAFGLSVVGLVWLGARLPWHGDVSSQLNLAPNMAELILLLGVVVQLRVRTVLLTAGAGIGILLSQSLTGWNHFGVAWPPVLVVITLLATDPATIPASAPGRALAGLALGLAMPPMGAAVAAFTGGWDFYGKVLLVPVLNLLAPRFDRLGQRLPAAVARALDFRHTRAHVAAWFCLVALLVASGTKMHSNEAQLHAESHTPLVQANADGTVGCERNPVFCRPFTFLDEAALWWASRRK